MARLRQNRTTQHRHRIAVIDDDQGLVRSMTRLLSSEGHEVLSAMTPEDGVELVRQQKPHLVLLDYHLPGGTGADVVAKIRTFDKTTEVLLVTGYASNQPARKLLAELDIQGYHDKADGPERLLVLIDAALKHYRALDRVRRQKASLRHIIDATPAIVQLQSGRQVLHAALNQLVPLLQGGGDGFIATANNGLFVFDGAAEGISIHAATGQFAQASGFGTLPSEIAEVVAAGLHQDTPHWHPRGYAVVPLETRNGERGCMVVQSAGLPADSHESCAIYAHLVVQALENVILFERATIDPLTCVGTRAFGMQRLQETLGLARRTHDHTSLLFLDLDHFKQINDQNGHAAGDVTLRAVARCLVDTVRTTDVVFRYGGEEFGVVLPATNRAGAEIVAERIRAAVQHLPIPFESKSLSITTSMGVSSACPEDKRTAAELLKAADTALYRAKSEGRNRVFCEPSRDQRDVA